MEAIEFTSEALADLEYWKKSGNTNILKPFANYCKLYRMTLSKALANLNH
ncbi:MAG: hypothetical protein ACHQIM_01655 [Sphingobacteriales bacterium]